jgi:hypothetical protein
MGHAVVAVEPTAALRGRAAALHPSSRIEWLEDGLPGCVAKIAAGCEWPRRTTDQAATWNSSAMKLA